MVLTACDDSEGTLEPSPEAASLREPVPPRTEGLGSFWPTMPDTALWDSIAARDSVVSIGIKKPGRERGVWNEHLLITRLEFTSRVADLMGHVGVSVSYVDQTLPVVTARIDSLETLIHLRSLPFVDYVEPNLMRRYPRTGVDTADDQSLMASSGGSSGCGWGSTVDPPLSTFAGDEMSANLQRMGVDKAWNRTSGEGAILGFTDTGVSDYQPELNEDFADGYSSGRWKHYDFTYGSSWHDYCGHGTRMAGVGAAPMNGMNISGVAWEANLVAIRQADGVVFVSAQEAADAIWKASEEPDSAGPRVVGLAWHSDNYHNRVSDRIGFHYSNDDILFIAASGSAPWGGDLGVDVIFPANMPEVVAVSAVHYPDYSQDSDVFYGPEVELAAYIDQATTGEYTDDVVSLGASSGATALMAGIATLVRAEYPNETNEQIRQRLREAAHDYPNRTKTYGYGVVNAAAAVDVLWSAWVEDTVTELVECQYATYDLQARHNGGNGPFSYSWSTGDITQWTRDVTLMAGQSLFVSVTVEDLYDGTALMGGKTIYGPSFCGPDPY